jgi:hypothetical protein
MVPVLVRELYDPRRFMVGKSFTFEVPTRHTHLKVYSGLSPQGYDPFYG